MFYINTNSDKKSQSCFVVFGFKKYVNLNIFEEIVDIV